MFVSFHSLNKLVRVLVALGFGEPELVHRLIILLSSYCIYLGHTYTHSVVRLVVWRVINLMQRVVFGHCVNNLTNTCFSILHIEIE